VCSSTNSKLCPSSLPACLDGKCVACTPGPNAPECNHDAKGPVCLVKNDPVCGCDTDDDCGGPQSGRICESNVCTDGCRGSDGNGCPNGLECSSTSAAPGTCQPPPVTTPEPLTSADSGDDGSCGCELPGRTGSPSFPALLALGAALGLVRLRQRRGTSSMLPPDASER
jgi:hypothetical protein